MTEKKKFIRRVAHDKENPYVMVRRETVQNKKLTYEASGMLSYMLSQRDDWRVQPNELIREGCGRDKVYRILKELIQKYYIEHEKSFNAQHKIVWGDYIVHEYPITENPDTENQDMDLREKPFPENPDTEKPDSNKYGNAFSKGSKSAGALHPLIKTWAELRGIDVVNIGAPIYTTKDTSCAKRMAKWEVPPSTDEIKAAITASKANAYAFQWLEADIPKARLAATPKPNARPAELDGITEIWR